MVVVASTIDTLSAYADDLLVVAENVLVDTDEGTPSLSYVTAAAPAFDCCPALMLHISRLAEAPTSPSAPAEATAKRVTMGSIILVSYEIIIIRCAANPDATGTPNVAEQTAVAHQVQQDGWALWNGLRHAVKNNEIFETCLGVHFDGGLPVREQGACVGWTFTIRASVPGIPNPGPGT
jgi:hypothetical protein